MRDSCSALLNFANSDALDAKWDIRSQDQLLEYTDTFCSAAAVFDPANHLHVAVIELRWVNRVEAKLFALGLERPMVDAVSPDWVFVTVAVLAAFSTYFCMCDFRMAFAAASFAGEEVSIFGGINH